MTVVRNLIKIIVPIIIVAGFFFIMSNFKHTQKLSLAEEKRIKEYASLMQRSKGKRRRQNSNSITQQCCGSWKRIGGRRS